MIGREKPGSVTELAEISGRSKSNLSRTLKTMSGGPDGDVNKLYAKARPGSRIGCIGCAGRTR